MGALENGREKRFPTTAWGRTLGVNFSMLLVFVMITVITMNRPQMAVTKRNVMTLCSKAIAAYAKLSLLVGHLIVLLV